jgi:hypothetical protein
MLLFSAGFAPLLFKLMPVEQARTLIRGTFPYFYVAVIAMAVLAAALCAISDPVGAAVLAAIALTTWPTRQVLMPAINRATDAGDRRRFAWLHGVSVLIGLAHIAAAGWVLVRLAG